MHYAPCTEHYALSPKHQAPGTMKTKIMKSNDIADSNIQSLQKEIDEINTTKKKYSNLVEHYENKQWNNRRNK